MFNEIIGWIASFCFAISAIPQAYKSYSDKHSNGVAWGFLNLWLVGEVGMLYYSLTSLFNWQLLFNYTVNLLCLSVIIYYKIQGK